MANICLPERFKKILNENQKINGIVNLTLYDFGEILQENKLYFFEEYTDHGIKHIENVLSGSDKLITENTFNNILKVEDIGYYILSVILHDLGMHLNYEGFHALISGCNNNNINIPLDNVTWENLWEEFLHEAKRFSGKQLLSIFGDEDTIIRNPYELSKGELNTNDRKLIGEFIRRNHIRLAHEIAINGMPGANGNSIEFAKELDPKIKNLIGLIARSHGMNLRSAVDNLETLYSRESIRNPYGVHAIYLMILLRLGDYLQIDASRTSSILLKLKKFQSPISEMEHKAHLAIDHVDHTYQADPERIFVTAAPKSSQMYLKLQDLVKSIQYEFDIAWAVIGEVYGNIEHKPQIKYRRITSNLENESFKKNQDYSPKYFTFKANDEIIKLLIAPLYGNDPKYGARELIQNAVDACLEKYELNKNQNFKYKPLIAVRIFSQNNESYFEISDNGLGMDVYEIQNYFLSAGASYRNSFEWKKQFTNEAGGSKIHRNGRFGIGALAAFLLGTEMYVETRKRNSETGFKFNAKLNLDQIEVIKDSSIKEGTLIKIKIDESVVNSLSNTNDDSILASRTNWYSWYTLSFPEIKYKIFGKEIIAYKKHDPYYLEKIPSDWNELSPDGFRKVLWSYSQEYSDKGLICNGIIIPSLNNYITTGVMSKVPNICVYDHDNLIPISLNRNKLTDKIPFNNLLIDDIYKEFIAYFLTIKNVSYADKKKIYIINQTLKYPGLIHDTSEELSYGYNIYEKGPYLPIKQILSSKKGYILNYNYFINLLNNRIDEILIQSEGDTIESIDIDIKDKFFKYVPRKLNSIDDYKSAIEYKQPDENLFDSRKMAVKLFIKADSYHYLFSSQDKKIKNLLNNKFKLLSRGRSDWAISQVNKPENSVITESFLEEYKNKINLIRESPIYCNNKGDDQLNELLEKYIGSDVIIPYSLQERKKKYPLAFKELRPYMEKYLKNNI